MFWTRPPVAIAPPSRSPVSERKALAVVHEGATYRVQVKQVATARRLTLRVRSADGIAVLTMPPRTSLKSAQAFADRYAAWIAARLSALPSRIPLLPGTMLPLRGTDHRITLDPTTLRRCQAGANPDGELLLRLSPRVADPGDAVLQFLLGEARRDLVAAVARHAAAVGRPVARITLRDTRSRWGSCSSKGTLNFSWRLILAPPLVLDYLAAHEVAHLVHMNHSDDFWRVTRSLAPETDVAEAWLKRHGSGLHRYGPAS